LNKAFNDFNVWSPNMPNIVIGIEAEYAFNTRKRIVAVRLQADYMPDGWLGPLCRNNLFYDFSAPEKFNDEWSKLHTKLKELKQPGWDIWLLDC